MEIGMLWFDDDSRRTLEEKLRRAMEHYLTKYGHSPTLCFVHPETLNGGPERIAGLHVRKSRLVMPNHFWIGFEDRAAPARRRANGQEAAKAEKRAATNGKRQAAGVMSKG